MLCLKEECVHVLFGKCCGGASGQSGCSCGSIGLWLVWENVVGAFSMCGVFLSASFLSLCPAL